MASKSTCFLCGQELPSDKLNIKPSPDFGDSWLIHCSLCGTSIMTDEARLEIASLGAIQRADLAAWVRERAVQGLKPPVICSSEYEGASSPSDYRISEILGSLVPKSIRERLDRILSNLASMSLEPGERCGVDDTHIYVCFARTPLQMNFYLGALREQGWLEQVADGWHRMLITPAGWNRLGELQARTARPPQTFVAMSFAEELEPAWREGIYKGIVAVGYRPLRVDKEEHNEKICDRLIAEIRRSSFLVADVTLHMQGVYFEAGYAMGLGLPVIWSCRKDQMSKCHFDTRQYNHIVWESPKQLAEALENRIRATIGEASP